MSPARAVVRATLGGAFARERGRLLLCILAIALGVALGFAVALINQTAVAEFEASVQILSGTADLEIRGPRGGFDERIFPVLARDPDVALASPVVEVDARLAGRNQAIRIIGVDAFRAAAVTPALIGSADDPLDLLRPDTIFLSPAAATTLDLAPGDRLAVQSGLAVRSLTIAGYARAGTGERHALMDIAATQDAFARVGLLTRIDLRLRPGVKPEAFSQRIAATLPAGVSVGTPQANASITTRMSRAYRVNLNVLALVALFTGGLLVFSTQALSVARRRAQFALLRTLGLARARLERLLLAEGAVIGTAGACIGLAGGYALARVALATFGADLGAGFFRGVAPEIVLDPLAALTFALLGVAVAMLGSLLPARAAARTQPATALKSAGDDRALAPLRSPWSGLTMLAAGALVAFLPPIMALPLPGYAAIALLLFGTLLLLPRIAALLLRRASATGIVSTDLAFAQLRANPGQLAMSLATIVASVSLMVAMAIMVGSFRQSLDAWLTRILPADVYVRAGAAGDSAFLSPGDQQRLAGLPGVTRIDFLRNQGVVLTPGTARVALLARDLPGDDPARALPLVGDARPTQAGDPPAVWVSEAIVDLFGSVPGSIMELPLAGVPQRFVVAGVWRDYARQQGALVIDRATYARLTGDRNATDAAVWLSPGTGIAAFRATLEAGLPDAAQLTLATPGEIRRLSIAVFDRTFAATYALEAAAVIIGLVGLSSSFGALVLARRREFGMLRHIGMTRRQIGTMLATEGLTVTGIGLAVGLVLGWAMSLILIHVVNRQSFHWGMDLSMPWQPLAALAATVLLLATATAVASARSAMSSDVVRAVKDDW